MDFEKVAGELECHTKPLDCPFMENHCNVRLGLWAASVTPYSERRWGLREAHAPIALGALPNWSALGGDRPIVPSEAIIA
jgi:hypothetical protein